MVRESGGQLIPEDAIYRVVLQVQPGQMPETQLQSLRGRVVINGNRKSLLGDYVRTALNVLIRETGW